MLQHAIPYFRRRPLRRKAVEVQRFRRRNQKGVNPVE